MKEAELIKIWKKSSDMYQIKMNLPLLVAELRNKIEATDHRIKNRDRREIIACIIGIIGFSFLAWDIPYFWSKMACLLCIGWFGYVIYRLKNASKDQQPDSSLSLIDQLSQRKIYLQRQAAMLNSVLYWYVIPPFIVNVLFVFGVGEPIDTWSSPLSTLMPYTLREKILGLSLIFVLYGYITWMNKKASKTNFPPLISEIERVQEELRKQEE